VLEIETIASREEINAVLSSMQVEIHFNGGFYTLLSSNHSAEELLKTLLNSSVKLSYFRDITHSTKRYFNS
jgi:ABC-2 type transport system ATP-binding protein